MRPKKDSPDTLQLLYLHVPKLNKCKLKELDFSLEKDVKKCLKALQVAIAGEKARKITVVVNPFSGKGKVNLR